MRSRLLVAGGIFLVIAGALSILASTPFGRSEFDIPALWGLASVFATLGALLVTLHGPLLAALVPALRPVQQDQDHEALGRGLLALVSFLTGCCWQIGGWLQAQGQKRRDREAEIASFLLQWCRSLLETRAHLWRRFKV